MCWDYIYEEECCDAKGCCCAGVISNGKNCLFFTVCRDMPGTKEICRVYNSISFAPETLECQYERSGQNDRILLNCLNSTGEMNYCGENSRIRSLHFVSEK